MDVTIPTVKEVKALGTKALKVVFSEPINSTTSSTTSAYKIDGKSIAGSVKFDYASNSVIISTGMTTGEHKLTVEDVADFAGLKVNAKDIAFTVANDTDAPVVASAKSIDLKKVEIQFNEPVKAISKAYHTSSGNTGTIKISDTKVTVEFDDTKRMGMSDTTIYFEGVEDYSGNKADRNVIVKPVLDTERPAVTSSKVELDSSNHKFTVVFNKEVKEADAKKGENYTLKDKDGKVVTGKGLDAKGHPIVAINYNSTKKEVTFSLVGKLDSNKYTLEVSGIQDNASIANTMMPYANVFEIGDTKAPTITKVWVEEKSTTGTPTKHDQYVYVQFSEAMANEGDGSVLDKVKYNYCANLDTPSWTPLPTDAKVELITADTVKISLPRTETKYIEGAKTGIRITLVADLAKNYLGTDYVATAQIKAAKEDITILSAKATAKDIVEVEFSGVLSNIDANDFKVNGKSVTLDSYKNEDGKTIATFKLAEADKLNANVNVNFTTGATISSQDAFGAKVKAADTKAIEDAIKAETIDINIANKKAFEVDGTAGTVTIKFDEELSAISSQVLDLVSVKVDGKEVAIDSMATATDTLVLTLAKDASGKLKEKADATKLIELDNNKIIEVSVKEANDTAKVIVDKATKPNSVKSFIKSGVYQVVKK